MRNTRPPHPQRRGTVIAFFLVLIAVLVTSLIATMAITTGGEAQVASLTLKRDQAFYAAEAGIQHALWKSRYANWAAQNYAPITGAAGSATYTTTVVANNAGTLTIQSVGSIANTATPISSTITCILGGLYPMPAIQLGGNFSAGGGAHVNGALMASGSISHHGNFNVNLGNVYAGGTIDSVSLDPGYQKFPNHNVPAAPDVTAIADSLKADAHAKTITSTGTLDFSQSSSGILVYTGDINNWKNPNVVGDGTLVVYGDVSIKSMSSFKAHNVNLVIVGNLNALPGSKFDLQGSLYVKLNISSQSQFAVQGVILCNGNMDTQGQGADIALLSPPSWDPRITSPLGGAQVTRFTGPVF